MRNLPIGTQTFSKILEFDEVYVDKTDLIWQLAQQPRVFFLSRPRRFGKSLMLSTLKSYFRKEEALFKGLKLERLQAESGKPWAQYPVIHLSMAGGGSSVDDLTARLDMQFLEVDEYYGIDSSDFSGGNRFARIIKLLSTKCNTKVVILIDEYDHPLLDTLESGKEELHEQFKEVLRNVYMNLKNYDHLIRFCMLTGVSQFSQLSLFSGLNSISILTLDKRYDAICGITQDELEANFHDYIARFAEARGIAFDEMVSLLRNRYDGYRFTAGGAHVYNPFCLLKALDSQSLSNYWMLTGPPKVVQYIAPSTHLNAQMLEEGIDVQVDDLSGMEDRRGRPIPLLYQTGYLTIKKAVSEEVFRLGFPNAEVKSSFAWQLLPGVLSQSDAEVRCSLDELKDHLYAQDIDGFMKALRPLFASVFGGNEPRESPLRESHFRNAMYVVFTMLNQKIRLEVPSSKGRADVELETPNAVYIFELKLKSQGETPKDALRQIGARGYAEKFVGGAKPIFCVGAVFNHEGGVEWAPLPYEDMGKTV